MNKTKEVKMKPITLEVSRGSNEGRAVYLIQDGSGLRVVGPKCWGRIRPIEDGVFTLDEGDLTGLRDECIRLLKKNFAH